jgi:16S rRNA G527 N7-methylase RsmG
MIKTTYLDSIVSRETLNKIQKYCDFLIKYNKNLNLISKSTESLIMNRHIEDSAQLLKYIDNKDRKILDIGSGAGFPGIVMEMVKKDLNINFKLDNVLIYRIYVNFLK